MAFNPFHTFRKNKKTAFAILTIICMCVFILSSGFGGKGDILSGGFTLFGDSRAPEVARIDGKKLTEVDLKLVRQHRRMANDYMRQLVYSAGEQLTQRVASRVNDLVDPIARGTVNQILQLKTLAQTPQSDIRDQFQQRYFQTLPELDRIAMGLDASKKSD